MTEMLLRNLRIRNFRSLQDFVVPTLGQVNLIVGKNNSGKSTVLEALRVLARQAHPNLLRGILRAHDESSFSRTTYEDSSEPGINKTFRHFFPGRTYPRTDDLAIYVGDEERRYYVEISHVHFIDDIEEIKDEHGEVARVRKRRVVSKQQLPLGQTQEFVNQGLSVSSSRSSRQGWIDLRNDTERYQMRPGLFWDELLDIPASYVPTQFLSQERLASLWDSVALTEGDAFVTKALQIIEPAVQGIAFIQGDPEQRTHAQRGRLAIVKLQDQSLPIPLNAMGDGMLRFMLIDEFENGLHFSVQKSAWELLFQLAARFHIQIFATTHSWDCIEAFKAVAVESEADGVLFRVGRSVRSSNLGQVIATTFSEKELANLTQSQVEVR
jgi:energy-coupling factor transporter ATP-binding protein EcfA2